MFYRVVSALTAIILVLPALSSFATNCDTASVQAIAPDDTTVSTAVTGTAGTTNYCDVTASITTDKAKGDVVTFELGLPDASAWNSRFLFTGNGGFAGSISLDLTDLGSSGYAVAATDTGHQGGGTDAGWALDNVPSVKDFEYRAVHKATVSAQAIVGSYYNNTSYHSYFSGCSTGGRQGLVEAQKYPADYDGIVAGDPAMGDPYIGFNWHFQALLQTSDSYLDPAAIRLIDQTVTTQCDGLDGVVDGLIQNPSACTFNPSTLLCQSGQSSSCLTAGQVATLNVIYAGVVDTHGNLLYPGYSMSNPAESDVNDAAWGDWLTGCKSSLPNTSCELPVFSAGVGEPWSSQNPPLTSPTQWQFMDGFLKDFVYDDLTYDSRTFSFTDQASIDKVQDASARWGGDGMNANIKPFTDLSHKLLMYHGWSDPALTPFVSVNYYSSVVGVLGNATPASFRLFMVPGMHHCGDGPGPNVFDTLTPLTQWVENGVLPDGIIATHYVNNDPTMPVDRTMPLCSYPELAQYNGVGPLNSASSWSCPTSGAVQSARSSTVK